MGRPVDPKTIALQKIFIAKEKLIVKQNKIVTPTSPIWANLCQNLPQNITINSKALYTAALKWWKNHQNNTRNETSDDLINSSGESDVSFISSSPIAEQKPIKFSIELSAKVWETIKPVTKIYSRKNEGKQNGVRSYDVLRPGVWTNVILDQVTKKRQEIPCIWIFETNKCYRQGANFLVLKARCKMCSATLNGTLEDEPDDDQPVNISFEITSLDLARHANVEPAKVKIGGEYAKKVYNKKKPATVIRRSLLRRKAALFVRPYGRVPTANAINQIKLYKAYKRKNAFTKVSCDASAGVANRLERPGDEKSGQIFFYTMVISDGFQAPVHQMLSEINDTNWITYFMSNWVSRTSEIPNQFTSDMSMALLNAAVKSFTSLGGVAAYIDMMLDLLQGNANRRLIPQCFIRIDIAHFMKNVTTCVALQNKPKKMRDFFIRCTAWLLSVDDLQEAKDHIFSILVVATSLTEGNSTTLGAPIPCEVHKKSLIHKITGHFKVEEAEKAADLVETSVLEDTFDETIRSTNMSLWVDDIWDDATETVSSLNNGDRDNLMFNQEFATYFKDLIRLFPLWSAVCCQFYPGSEKTASSGNVESHIKVVKQSMEDLIPCSVDKFIQENIDITEGIIIEASQDYIQFISNREPLEFDFTTKHTQNPELKSRIGMEPEKTILSISEENSLNEIQSTIEIRDSFECVDTDINNSTNDETTEAGNNDRENTSEAEILMCPVCKDKNWPTGAHKCFVCSKNVHIFAGCSVSIGGSEGYGEKRLCVSCDKKHKKFEKIKVSEMVHTEKWCRTSKRQIKKSKYREAVPNWDLNHQFDKNVKIGFLTNGNMSLRVFGTKNRLIAVKNSCIFDVLAQILAAVYAYLPSPRSRMDEMNGIFEIAVALAKNDNMNKVNNMRARLLSKFDSGDLCQMMKLTLNESPACVFTWKCNLCKMRYSVDFTFLQVKANSELSSLSGVIDNQLKCIISSQHFCTTCETMMPYSEFQFGFCLFITVMKDEVAFDQIPEIVKIREENWILFGAILNIDPFIEGDQEHYVAAIKTNATWSIFDDKKTKPYFVAAKKVVSVHTLVYTKKTDNFLEQTQRTVEKNSDDGVGAKNSIKRKRGNRKENEVEEVIAPKVGKYQNNGQKSSTRSIEQIGLLSNGCSYKVGHSTVIVENTCGFDSIAHILAAAFATSESYKNVFQTTPDEICRIAIMLANSDSKKKINDARSKLLLNLFGRNNAFVVDQVLSKTLKETPSLREILSCTSECCNFEKETLRPFLTMSMNVFNNNMANIEVAIAANLNIMTNCNVCENNLCVNIRREYGRHLFIEMPVSSLAPRKVRTERIITYKISQLKLSLKLDGRSYSLFGLILFQPPEATNSLGHYVAAVNLNESYYVIDDLRQTPYILEPECEIVIHCLFYIEDELLGGHVSDNSSFELTTYSHTDESLYRLYHNT